MQDPRQQQWLLEPGGIASRLRELQGRTPGTVFAERAGMRPSKVSKLRLGQQLPTEEDIRRWVSAAGGDITVEQGLLVSLAEAPMNHSSFERRLKHGQARRQHDYNELVEQADIVRMLERSFVPRLLQTADYARAVLKGSAKTHKSVDDIDAAVVARLGCQRLLYDGQRRFEFILDETVLIREVGSASIMHDQVDRLLAAVGLSNVRIGIIPVHAKLHDVVRNSFELYGRIGIVESYYNDDPLTDEQWKKYDVVMSDLWQDAVEGEAARKLILEAITHHAEQAAQQRPERT